MANIKTIIDYPIADGSEITFRSPLDYHNITGLTVCYPDADGNETSKNFTFVDAHRNDVTQLSDLFAQNAIVKVILDYTNGLAFIQNADTNAYLEEKFSRVLFIKDSSSDGEEVELLPEPIYEDQKGVPGGVATLDLNGKLVQMPSAEDVRAISTLPLGKFDSGTTIAELIQGFFDQLIRWGNFQAALLPDLPPETINWDHGVEFKVATGYWVEVRATSLNGRAFFRLYEANDKVWATGWKELATTDYALPRDGSIPITGNLCINQPGKQMTNNNLTMILDNEHDGILSKIYGQNHAHILANANDNTAWFNYSVDNAAHFSCNMIHHTGNKPSGSYTGNGDATTRTIDTGGIGECICIYSDSGGVALITRYGGILTLSTTLSSIFFNVINFSNGIITINSSNEFNTNGFVYHYQVL